MSEKKEPLAIELETYRKLLPSLLAQQGKFVVVTNTRLVGTYDTYADALQQGYSVRGLEPFLVKKISGTEEIAYFTRDIRSKCHTSAT
jgi:hypothetical protein